MLVGDLIARFEDEAVAAEALLAIEDIGLTAEVSRAAAEQEVTVGEFAAAAVQRFANQASNEEWMTMMGRIARAEDPGLAFLRHVLSVAVGRGSQSPKARLHIVAGGRAEPRS